MKAVLLHCDSFLSFLVSSTSNQNLFLIIVHHTFANRKVIKSLHSVSNFYDFLINEQQSNEIYFYIHLFYILNVFITLALEDQAALFQFIIC